MKLALLKTKKLLFTLIVAVLAVVLVLLGFWFKGYQEDKIVEKVDAELSLVNDALIANDKPKALTHARKALKQDPNSPEAILAVANLLDEKNPTEARSLYSRALDEMRNQNNPDVDGKKAPTYWAAANLAEKAGKKNDAKKYYQKVMDSADTSNDFEMSLKVQAHSALQRLK